MRKKPILVIDHLRTTQVQVDGKLMRRHCFEWHNRQDGGAVKLLIELLNSRGKVQHSATINVMPMRRINNQHIIIEEANTVMPALFRYRTGQGWETSQSATGEFGGGYYEEPTGEAGLVIL